MVIGAHRHQQAVPAGKLLINRDLFRFVAPGVDLEAIDQRQDLLHQVLVGHRTRMGVDRQAACRVDGLDRLLRRRDRGIELGWHEIDSLANALPGVLFRHQALLQDELEHGARHDGRPAGNGDQVSVVTDALLAQDLDPRLGLAPEDPLGPVQQGQEAGMVEVNPMAEDMAHLIGRVGGDLEGPHVTEAPAMRHRPGTVDAAEGVVIGQRHDPHPTVGGQVGHLVGVAPAVADCRVHVEIGQHDAQSSGRLPGSGRKLLSNVTDFLGFPVGDE